jgi:hypothetical protein
MERQEIDKLRAELNKEMRVEAYLSGYRDALQKVTRLRASGSAAGGDGDPDPATRLQ